MQLFIFQTWIQKVADFPHNEIVEQVLDDHEGSVVVFSREAYTSEQGQVWHARLDAMQPLLRQQHIIDVCYCMR
jgi:hypothetical protein